MHPVYLLFLHLEVFLNPVDASQASHVVTRHAAYRIAQGGRQYADSWTEPDVDQRHQHQFGTEGNDAAGQQGRNEQSDIAPVDEQLYQCVYKSVHTLKMNNRNNNTSEQVKKMLELRLWVRANR